jgi:hypothetical protein
LVGGFTAPVRPESEVTAEFSTNTASTSPGGRWGCVGPSPLRENRLVHIQTKFAVAGPRLLENGLFYYKNIIIKK